MAKASDTDISKFLSYVLRHAPQEAGLRLDENGWTEFEILKQAVKAKFGVEDSDLLRVIAENPKKRFTLDGDRIRAAQGHSVDVELALKPVTPPSVLFHGTTLENWSLIANSGLQKMERTHVHLSQEIDTAKAVAKRRKGPHVLLAIDSSTMFSKGHHFFLSDNGVWLSEHVPPQFLTLLPDPV
jgi:putative RNA 2'-phosphotransferase